MSYPTLELDPARTIDAARRAGDVAVDIDSRVRRKEGADFDNGTAFDCLNQCYDLLGMVDDDSSSPAQFDAQCAPLVHASLNLPERIAGDADFWRWLTFVRDCEGAEIVDWRYGRRTSDGSAGIARPVYYGLESMKKGMFAKLWICANAMYIEGETHPYDGIEYADVDLWDSHVIDVDYGSSPVMARAFVKIVRDMKLPRGEPNRPDAPAGFRDLAKEIRRRQATIAFELFDERVARAWVEDLWDERMLWCHKR